VQVLYYFFTGVVLLDQLYKFEDTKGTAYKSLILISFYNRVF